MWTNTMIQRLREDQRLDEDVHFPSDCAVAAAVCLKCISANSCAIRVGGVEEREKERGRHGGDGLPR